MESYGGNGGGAFLGLVREKSARIRPTLLGQTSVRRAQHVHLMHVSAVHMCTYLDMWYYIGYNMWCIQELSGALCPICTL